MQARLARRAAVLPAALAVLLSGCGPAVDLKQTVQITDLSGGYYDAGIVDGKNKLVPSVTFRVVRAGEQPRSLALNVHFRKIVGDQLEEWDEVFLQSIEFAEGGRTAPLTVRSKWGYTGDAPQTRAEMLKHSQFQDMRVIIFGRQTSANWVELGRYDLPRQLLTD